MVRSGAARWMGGMVGMKTKLAVTREEKPDWGLSAGPVTVANKIPIFWLDGRRKDG